MRAEIEWLDDALSTKDLSQVMTHYRVKDRFMTATNGRMVAGHPCSVAGEFLVPGSELKQIFKRLPGQVTVTIKEGKVLLRSGKFSGTLEILPETEWNFPEVIVSDWKPFPISLLPSLRDLRPFVCNDALPIHRWSVGVALDDGWCYATNNVVLAGAPHEATKGVHALIPAWVVDFLIERSPGLTHWAVTDHYMAFKWSNGAWMRSNLIEGIFPEKAGAMIRSAPTGPQTVDTHYRQSVTRVAELSDDIVYIYADRAEGKTVRSTVSEEVRSEVPENSLYSLWSGKHLTLVMNVATNWNPAKWPQPVPFRGARVMGYIAGRTA